MEKYDESDRDVNEVMNTTVVQCNEDNGTDSHDDNISTKITTTTANNNNDDDDVTDRFRWKYNVQHNEANKITTTKFPFWDNDNIQDLYFTEKVLAVIRIVRSVGNYSVAMLLW